MYAGTNINVLVGGLYFIVISVLNKPFCIQLNIYSMDIELSQGSSKYIFF